jgi:N-acetylglutamate synthase-like GNAT family acetyltransferase
MAQDRHRSATDEEGQMIRPLAIADVPAAVSLIREEWDPRSARDATRQFNSMFGEAPDPPHYLVADEDGAIVGVAGFRRAWIMQGTYEFCWIAIDKAHRGRGIGHELTERRIEEIDQRGGALVLVMTGKVAFFEQFGFRALADFDGQQLMALRLARVKFGG